MKKVLFVYNPKAGKGEVRASLSDILEIFTDADMEVTVHPTRSAGDAVAVFRDNASRYDLLVCSGGDGTLDEAVTGLMQGGAQVPIGYIPAGSTNDFGSSLGLSTQKKTAAEAITRASVFRCDVGKLNDRYFVYVAAFGAFTEVSYKTSQDMKNMLGHAAYILEGIRSLPTVRSWKLRYESEEQSGEGEFIYGMVTNSNSVGGFKGITGNNVDLSDGLFEVTLIRMPESIVEWPAVINALLTKTPHEKVITFKTARMTIVCEDEEVPWTADGEYGGSWKEVRVENLREALPLLVAAREEDAREEKKEDESGPDPA